MSILVDFVFVTVYIFALHAVRNTTRRVSQNGFVDLSVDVSKLILGVKATGWPINTASMRVRK